MAPEAAVRRRAMAVVNCILKVGSGFDLKRLKSVVVVIALLSECLRMERIVSKRAERPFLYLSVERFCMSIVISVAKTVNHPDNTMYGKYEVAISRNLVRK